MTVCLFSFCPKILPCYPQIFNHCLGPSMPTKQSLFCGRCTCVPENKQTLSLAKTRRNLNFDCTEIYYTLYNQFHLLVIHTLIQSRTYLYVVAKQKCSYLHSLRKEIHRHKQNIQEVFPRVRY